MEVFGLSLFHCSRLGVGGKTYQFFLDWSGRCHGKILSQQKWVSSKRVRGGEGEEGGGENFTGNFTGMIHEHSHIQN